MARLEISPNESHYTRDADARANGSGQPSKWTVLAIVAIGVFMATVDSSIVNISLPAIARYFGVPLSGAVAWGVIAYLVVVAALLLRIGPLAGLLWRQRIWAIGLAPLPITR